MVVPRQKNKKRNACTAKETNNGRTIPGERIATVLDSEQQLDGSRCEDYKINKIELCRKRVNN